MQSRLLRVVILLTALAAAPARPSAQAGDTGDPLSGLVQRLEAALAAGDRAAFDAMLSGGAPADTAQFAVAVTGARTTAVVRERHRNPAPDGASATLLFDTFIERGPQGRLSTWSADAVRTGNGWRFAAIRQLASVDGLYRLSLDPAPLDVRNLTLKGTDITLEMRSGTAYAARVEGGMTALVLRGKGEMIFTPQDDAERAQLRIFSGEPVLRAGFTDAFVRLNPGDLEARVNEGALVPRERADGGDQRQARAYFDQIASKTYSLDLQDLSRERWSLVPAQGDMVAEVRTRKYGDLTYARSASEAEDISLFHRESRRNISVYASAPQLERRGRFYSEDDSSDYDILEHDIDVRMTPAREWIEGTARLRARVRALSMSTVRLRLAEALVVRSIVSPEHGRLMHLRVVGQNNVIVTLPKPAQAGELFELEVRYGGRVASQLPDREAAAVTAQDFEPITIPPEPRWIYSNRSYWYPQSMVTDYATARLRITVPEPLEVVATGVQSGAPVAASVSPGSAPSRTFTFESGKPSRYLSCLISRFTTVTSKSIGGGAPATLTVVATPRQGARGRATAEQAERIFTYYRSLLGSAPYPQLTVAVSESDLPGGHSPAYFVIVNQILPTANVTWRADPVSFDNYPSFFLAHEIAHQWWGQAVSWKNYHEQWISEGFAQYFAALYAGEMNGPVALTNVIRQMRRFALERTDEGPIYLGYRLGHLEGDSRAFRAVVYNKSAVVLHMLRRMAGDERFFAGLRRFYEQSLFEKAGTEDFRRIMEDETGLNLERFFERWIYGFGVPSVKVSHAVETSPDGTSSVVVRAQQQGLVYDLPITIAIEQENGSVREAVLVMTAADGELRVPVEGRVRRVTIDSDAAALARFLR